MRVAITCIQLIRDLADVKKAMETAGFDVRVPAIKGQYLEGEQLVEALEGCVGVVAGDDQFTAEVLNQLPSLRVISKWGVGIDGIDCMTAAAQGITVTNTPGEFDEEVADVAMAYIVMLLRKLHVIDNGVKHGGWPKPAGHSIQGMKLGIIGLGGIGCALTRRAVAAGMDVLGTDPDPERLDMAERVGASTVHMNELISTSDIVSLHCPLTSETHHLLGADRLHSMKPGAFLVNTGRGALIDTAALAKCLNSGHLAGAALDVLEEEPPGRYNPILDLDNVILGSHNASNTLEASARTHRKAIANLANALGKKISFASDCTQ